MNRLGFRHDNLRRTLPDVLAQPAPAVRRGLHAFRDGRRCPSRRVSTNSARASIARSPRSARWACASVSAARRQFGGAPARQPHVVRRGASRPAALRRRAAAAVGRGSRAETCPVTHVPYRGGEGRARRRGHRLRTALAGRRAADDRDRARRLRRRPRHARRPAARACSSAAAARRSSAPSAWT